MQTCARLLRVSRVPTRALASLPSVQYHPRYNVPRKMSLSRRFDTVTEENRFLSLELLLGQLSGYVGRRQYKMQCELTAHLDVFKRLGVDWHDLKQLSRDELIDLLTKEAHLGHAERAVLLIAVEQKVCGVLCQSDTRHSTRLCMSRGVEKHGWRCGRHGHTRDVYFEGKEKANMALLRVARRSSWRLAERDGIYVDVHNEPDFTVAGRQQHDLQSRVWRSPEHANFSVTMIGYEFRVHPDDPRALQQVENAAAAWELHAAVTQQVIWEMLEVHGVARGAQPLTLTPGEMGEPDVPQRYASAFTSLLAKRPSAVPASSAQRSSSESEAAASTSDARDAETTIVVEQRMRLSSGDERPWFTAPLPQQFVNGIPTILPFAPTIVIHSAFRQVRRSFLEEDVSQQLLQPVMDVSCLVHPNACFSWSPTVRGHCVRQILDYAKRVPFALPFNLYFRVDTTREMQRNTLLQAEMQRLLREKSKKFDLRHFRAVQGRQEGEASSNMPHQ